MKSRLCSSQTIPRELSARTLCSLAIHVSKTSLYDRPVFSISNHIFGLRFAKYYPGANPRNYRGSDYRGYDYRGYDYRGHAIYLYMYISLIYFAYPKINPTSSKHHPNINPTSSQRQPKIN